MKIIIGDRQTGRTTTLLIEASKSQNPSGAAFICRDHSISEVKQTAQELGVPIKHIDIFSYHDFAPLIRVSNLIQDKDVFIDDLDSYMHYMFQRRFLATPISATALASNIEYHQ